MGPVPLVPGVAPLLVPGAEPPVKGEALFAYVTLHVTAEVFPNIVVESLEQLFGWKRLVGPGEGRVIAPVPTELFRADACPIWICEFSNSDHTQPDADTVDLAEFVVAHPFLLSHLAGHLHEGLIICLLGQGGSCVLNFDVGCARASQVQCVGQITWGRGSFLFFEKSKNELVRPKMVFLAILAKK